MHRSLYCALQMAPFIPVMHISFAGWVGCGQQVCYNDDDDEFYVPVDMSVYLVTSITPGGRGGGGERSTGVKIWFDTV